jgi:hypothetical protein
MSNSPFGEPPEANPYASPASQIGAGSPTNPLLIPAIALLILSLLFVLIIIISLPGQIARISAIDTTKPEGAGRFLGQVTSLIAWPLMNLAVALGAVSMIRLKGYRSAFVAAILSVIPCCSPCFVFGIPFGIWAIVLLSRSDVKQLFMEKPVRDFSA